MIFPQPSCWLAGTLGLLVVVAPPSGAQQANSQAQPNRKSASSSDQPSHQKSQAYKSFDGWQTLDGVWGCGI